MVKLKRPKWMRGYRAEVIAAQDGKCAECGEKIDSLGSELHHDYRGAGWVDIHKLADEVLPSLGFDAATMQAFKRDQYHHRGSVAALHPDCHVKADRALLAGRISDEQFKKSTR